MKLLLKTFLAPFFIAVAILTSCKDSPKSNTSSVNSTDSMDSPNYVTVSSTGMNFEMVDDIPYGWTTFKYENNSLDPHFFILEKMPDSLGIEAFKQELIPPFLAAFKHFDQGNIEAGMQAFQNIPEWFQRVELGGGVGLTSGQTSSESTVYLSPGTYVMECYVRMPDGMAHTFMGMLKELRVQNTPNNLEPPKADLPITISSERGIQFVDSLKAGSYTFSVDFEDQKKYEHMLGHDVNLVKLENDSLVTTLGQWLNTANIKAFRTPAPKGVSFLGGVEDLPEKSKGFFKVQLDPGHYLLISEIPNCIERKMYTGFKVY